MCGLLLRDDSHRDLHEPTYHSQVEVGTYGLRSDEARWGGATPQLQGPVRPKRKWTSDETSWYNKLFCNPQLIWRRLTWLCDRMRIPWSGVLSNSWLQADSTKQNVPNFVWLNKRLLLPTYFIDYCFPWLLLPNCFIDYGFLTPCEKTKFIVIYENRCVAPWQKCSSVAFESYLRLANTHDSQPVPENAPEPRKKS